MSPYFGIHFAHFTIVPEPDFEGKNGAQPINGKLGGPGGKFHNLIMYFKCNTRIKITRPIMKVKIKTILMPE